MDLEGVGRLSRVGFPTRDERCRMTALIGELVVLERQQAAVEARKAEVLAELGEIAFAQHERAVATGGTDEGWAHRAMEEEIAAATGLSRAQVASRMATAAALTGRFRATFLAIARGGVSMAHAQVIIDNGDRLADDEDRAAYETEMLARAGSLGEQLLPTGRLRPVAKRLAEQVLPESLTDRHRKAREQRRVFVTEGEDGMATVAAFLPAVLCAGIRDRLTRMAKETRSARSRKHQDELPDGNPSATDERTLDQLRADLFADMLLTGAPQTDPGVTSGGLGALRATVQVIVPAVTLAGLSDESAFLAGHGPLDPDTAKHLAGGEARWDRLFTHPDTGVLLTVDQYKPTTAQRRFLWARDEHCRFPGCRFPASRCETDHTIPYGDDGPTDVANLACLCKSHHVVKHHTRWQVKQLGDGILEWTSPAGRTYLDRPPPLIRFTPADSTATGTAPTGTSPPDRPCRPHRVDSRSPRRTDPTNIWKTSASTSTGKPPPF